MSTWIGSLVFVAAMWAGGAFAVSEFTQENWGAGSPVEALAQSDGPPTEVMAPQPPTSESASAGGKALTLPVPLSDLMNVSPDALIARLQTESATLDGQVERFDLSPEASRRILAELGRFDPQTAPKPGSTDAVGESPLPLSPDFAIFGEDQRDQIVNTTQYPYRTIGFLGGGCTGTLIGRRHVLTAGHCVYNFEKDQWKKVDGFWPGQNGKISPYGKVNVVRLLSITGWTRDHNWNFDIGMAVLGANVGDRVGWMAYGWEEPMPHYNINLIGYPADKERFTMWHSYCPLDDASDLKLSYKCEQVPGNSGGPIFVYWRDKNQFKIVGVVSNEQVGGSAGHRTANVQHYPADARVNLDNAGTLINKIKFETIKGWTDKY